MAQVSVNEAAVGVCNSIWFELDGLGVVVEGILALAQRTIRDRAVVIGHGSISAKLDDLGVIVDGVLVLLYFDVNPCPPRICGGVVGVHFDSLRILTDSLFKFIRIRILIPLVEIRPGVGRCSWPGCLRRSGSGCERRRDHHHPGSWRRQRGICRHLSRRWVRSVRWHGSGSGSGNGCWDIRRSRFRRWLRSSFFH